jgi:hypothetical protein
VNERAAGEGAEEPQEEERPNARGRRVAPRTGSRQVAADRGRTGNRGRR